MINKSKDLWQIDLKEIQKIKSGILKYIGGNQVPKNRDKNSNTPSEPKTPKKNSNKQGKKSSRNNQSNIEPLSPFRLEKQPTKDKNPISGQMQPMPKGFWRGKNGKIMRNEEEQMETMDQLAYKLNKSHKIFNSAIYQKKKMKSNKKDQMSQAEVGILQSPRITLFEPLRDEKYKKPQQSTNKQELNQDKNNKNNQIDVTNENMLKIQTKKDQTNFKFLQNTQLNQQKVATNQQNNSSMSVSQIAKLFGGGKNIHKQVVAQQSKIDKDITKKQYQIKHVPLNIQTKQANIRQTKNQEDQKSSLASFGKYQKKVAPFRKTTIGEFLGISGQKAQKQKQSQRQRKRSHTLQQGIPQFSTISNTNRKSKNQQNIRNSLSYNKNTSDSNFSIKVQPSLKDFKLNKQKQIQPFLTILTEEQQEQLKTKYNVLSLKLDSLKERVIQESENAIGNKRDLNSPSYKRISAIMLYNKYSPLKVLQKKRQEKKRQYDHQISLTFRSQKQKKSKKGLNQFKSAFNI